MTPREAPDFEDGPEAAMTPPDPSAEAMRLARQWCYDKLGHLDVKPSTTALDLARRIDAALARAREQGAEAMRASVVSWHKERAEAAASVARQSGGSVWSNAKRRTKFHADCVTAVALVPLPLPTPPATGQGADVALGWSLLAQQAVLAYLTAGGEEEGYDAAGKVLAARFAQPPAGVGEREAFEAWAKGETMFEFLSLERYSFDDAPYLEEEVERAWRAWQARAGRRPA